MVDEHVHNATFLSSFIRVVICVRIFKCLVTV